MSQVVTQLIKVIQTLKLVPLNEFKIVRGVISYLFVSRAIAYRSDTDFVRRILYGRHETISSDDYSILQPIRKNRDKVLWLFLEKCDAQEAALSSDDRISSDSFVKKSNGPKISTEIVKPVHILEPATKVISAVEPKGADNPTVETNVPSKRPRDQGLSNSSNRPLKRKVAQIENEGQDEVTGRYTPPLPQNEQVQETVKEIAVKTPLEGNTGREALSVEGIASFRYLLVGCDDDTRVQEWIKVDSNYRLRAGCSPSRDYKRLPRQRFRLTEDCFRRSFKDYAFSEQDIKAYLDGDECRFTCIALRHFRDAELYIHDDDPTLVKDLDDDQDWTPDLSTSTVTTSSRRSRRKKH